MIEREVKLNNSILNISNVKKKAFNSNFPHICSKKFSFKYLIGISNHKLDLNYIKNVNEKIDKIIEKFKKTKIISEADGEYFIENSIFYNFENNKIKLRIVLNILSFLVKKSENKIELKSDNSTKIHKNYKIIARNNIDLFDNLSDFLNIKNDYENFNIIVTNIKFFISDLINDFIENKIDIKQISDLKKIEFINENYIIIIELIDSPFFKNSRNDYIFTN